MNWTICLLLILQFIMFILACFSSYKFGYWEGRVDAMQEVLERGKAVIKQHAERTRGWN